MDMKKFRVPKTAITERGLKRLIKEAAKEHSSLGEWAKDNDITAQQVSAFFAKTQGAGLKIPAALGYRPQTIYLPVDEDLICALPPPRRATERQTAKTDPKRSPIEKRGLKRVDEREEAKKRLKKRNKK